MLASFYRQSNRPDVIALLHAAGCLRYGGGGESAIDNLLTRLEGAMPDNWVDYVSKYVRELGDRGVPMSAWLDSIYDKAAWLRTGGLQSNGGLVEFFGEATILAYVSHCLHRHTTDVSKTLADFYAKWIPSYGICDTVKDYIYDAPYGQDNVLTDSYTVNLPALGSAVAWRDLFYSLARDWEYFSHNRVYPVPRNKGDWEAGNQRPDGMARVSGQARIAFLEARNVDLGYPEPGYDGMWAGEYGELREDLLVYVIRNLTGGSLVVNVPSS